MAIKHAFFTIVFGLVIVVSQSKLARAEEPLPASERDTGFLYDIIVDDKDIGDIKVTIKQTQGSGYSLFKQSHIQTEGWWGKIEIRSNYHEIYNRDNELQEIDAKDFDGETVWWTQVQRKQNQLWGVTSEIKNFSQKEEEQLLAMISGITSMVAPAVGDVLSISQILLSTPNKTENSVRFDYTDFVTSLDNLPFYWLQQGKKLPNNIRLLDSEKLVITSYQVTQNDNLYKLESDDAKSIDLWLAVAADGIPYFTRLETEDSDGPLTILLK